MNNNYYSETRDVYLEILHDAQKVEDRKLIALIGSRLREFSLAEATLDSGCKIIPFPASYSVAADPYQCKVPEVNTFWPRFGFRHILWLLFCYVVLILGGLCI